MGWSLEAWRTGDHGVISQHLTQGVVQVARAGADGELFEGADRVPVVVEAAVDGAHRRAEQAVELVVVTREGVALAGQRSGHRDAVGVPSGEGARRRVAELARRLAAVTEGRLVAHLGAEGDGTAGAGVGDRGGEQAADEESETGPQGGWSRAGEDHMRHAR